MELSAYRLLSLLSVCALGCAAVWSPTSERFLFATEQPGSEDTRAPLDSYTDASYDGTTFRLDSGFSSTEAPSTLTEEITTSALTTPAPTKITTTALPTNATTTLPTNATTTALPTNATTAAPTNATTTALPTNATTAAPTNATTALPTNTTTVSTPAPTTLPPVPNPDVGSYVVRSEFNASACLMASMGLQFRFAVGGSMQTVNLDPSPNVTNHSGTCGRNGTNATLVLTSDQITVQFVFSNQMNRFYLSALSFTADTESGSTFSAVNSSLSLWEASLGSSYMCQMEQSFNITDSLLLNTFRLRVQPFNVTNNKFGTVEACFLDTDLSFVVPIAVGVALSFLILLVLVSYLIGRRKSHTGYQSV